jgi:hypothetical protein
MKSFNVNKQGICQINDIEMFFQKKLDDFNEDLYSKDETNKEKKEILERKLLI